MTVKKFIPRPSNISKTLICVDQVVNNDVRGRLFNPYRKDPVLFYGAWGMLQEMENMLDAFGFPAASFQNRSFRKKNGERPEIPAKDKEMKRFMSDDIFRQASGNRATFVVQVQFRQNATWQGSIVWLEQEKSQRFRSALEMLKLIDEAVSTENEQTGALQWDCADEKAI